MSLKVRVLSNFIPAENADASSQVPVNSGTRQGDCHHCPRWLNRINSHQLEGSPMKEMHSPSIETPRPGLVRKPLPPVALTALRSIQTTKVFPKGHEFFLEGQAPTGIYIVYSGRVDLSVTDAHGREMVLGTALPGDVLGLSGALSGKHYEETAMAAATCQTGFVRCEEFLRFLNRHPAAAFWVVQLLSERVTTTLDQLSCISHLPNATARH